MRILKTLDLKMARTVRMALWTGEEEGLLGSKAYVKEHFADRETMALKPEHARLSGYFNLDNGSGKIRGAYLQGNDMMRTLFEAWLAPFKDYGASTVTIRNTGGTDHLSFDAVGLPGFQFIQDPLDYSTETHHSNMDVFDHLQAGDLMEASAIMAAVVYQAATRDEMLPRKPLPKPEPKKKEGEERPAAAELETKSEKKDRARSSARPSSTGGLLGGYNPQGWRRSINFIRVDRRAPGYLLPILRRDTGPATEEATSLPRLSWRSGSIPERRSSGSRPYKRSAKGCPGSTGARNRSTWPPILHMACPTTSSGPAGAVVEATRITDGLERSKYCRLRPTETSSSVHESA